MNAINSMKENDLIWTRRNSTYYICRVKNNTKYHEARSKEKKDFWENDIWHYVECDFYEVGTEEKVLGCIINNMNSGGAVKGFNKYKEIVTDFSKIKYNEMYKKANSIHENYYPIKEINSKWEYFWSAMNPELLEELCSLYLQIEKGYGIYISTKHRSTKQYEFVLFDKKNGQRAYLQVKEHNINIEEYEDITKNDILYIFSNNNTQYKENGNIKRITREEIQDFINKNSKILPEKIKAWLI